MSRVVARPAAVHLVHSHHRTAFQRGNRARPAKLPPGSTASVALRDRQPTRIRFTCRQRQPDGPGCHHAFASYQLPLVSTKSRQDRRPQPDDVTSSVLVKFKRLRRIAQHPRFFGTTSHGTGRGCPGQGPSPAALRGRGHDQGGGCAGRSRLDGRLGKPQL